MNYDRSTSRCSSSVNIGFHWFDGVSSDQAAIERATERFMSALSGPVRLWNPYSSSMVKSEFKGRIRKACAGALQPVDEVKGVDEERPAPLYEIRWQDVNVTERESPTASPVHLTVLVRMYHSEPAEEPEVFIGHHIHEKVTDAGVHIYAAQDAEIAVARNLYYLGEGRRWEMP